MKSTDEIETAAKRAPGRKMRSSTEKQRHSEVAVESKPVTDFQGHIKGMLREKFADIMEAMAQKSIEGSLSHTKYLFEIGGVREELLREIENNGEPTLADLLLEEVRRRRDLDAANSATEAIHGHGEVETANHAGQTEINRGAKIQ